MLKCLSFLFLAFSVTNAISEVHSNGRLARIMLLSNSVSIGQQASVMVYPEKFDGDILLDSIVKGNFEGQDVNLERFGEDLWRFKSSPLLENKIYTFIADIYIEDKKQANITRSEIEIITREITQIEYLMIEETDPVVRESLSTERNIKIENKEQLLEILELLRTYVGSEVFTFVPNQTELNNY